MGKYCFGADLGGTTVKLGLFDATGELVEKWEIPTDTGNNGEHILEDIASAIKGKMLERGIKAEDTAGIGIDVPGPVTPDGCVKFAVNIGWGYRDVSGEMEELTGIPCTVGNDANVAALGEMWKGSAAGHRNVLMLTLGTGVGGGVIVDGRILNGANGAAGEVGHFHVTDDLEDVCGCGNQGCLEQYASATGIARLARNILKEKPDTPSLMRDTDIMQVSAKTVFDAVKQGDALAVETAERFGKVTGAAIAGMTAVLDPEVIVIGGGVSKAGEILLDYIRKYYVPRAFKSTKDTPFVIASLGNDAGIYGCAGMVMGNK